jgi:hypothetical protein
MRDFSFRTFSVQFLQKRYKIFALVFFVRCTFHSAGKHIQRGEYRGCAVSEANGALTGGNMRL